MIKFENNSNKIIKELGNEIINALEEASGELEAEVKRNTKVKTGKTKQSWQHTVDEQKYVAYVGSNYENAIREEFGTGIYALNGNGRKDVPWHYMDESGQWHSTKGKKPRRAFKKAYLRLKPLIKKFFKERLKDL